MATLYAYSPNGTQATLSYSVIGFTQSLAQNGWCKLPNGLIFQWRFDTFTSQNQIVYFPISFTYDIFLICTQNHYNQVNGSSNGWFSSVPLSWGLDSINVYYCDYKGFLLAIGV